MNGGVDKAVESVSERKLLVLFDSDCGFCSRCVHHAVGPWFAADCRPVAFHTVDLAVHDLTVDKCAETLHCVAPDGEITLGHEAVAAILIRSRSPWPLVGRALLLPGIRRVAAGGYALVAGNRYRLPGGTAACRINGGQEAA